MHPLAVAVLKHQLKEWGPAAALSSIILATLVTAVLLLPSPAGDGGAQGPASLELLAEQERAGEEHSLTDISSDAGPAGLRIPAKPSEWQKGPPCLRGEHAINGACYQRYAKEDMSPPCDAGVYEHDGQCWRAIHKAPRKPASIQP